ncbi:hypothetical protein PYW08_016668 [Mythimna loreyi]|uniref:Uncharacterized protein n=1 Tax=Mythimna loreyi TaxID=667449 RepID=A0ACC2QYP4_9NEOP|nr:hypothetical protein PYW08_016668 [Mythimna loreyi]
MAINSLRKFTTKLVVFVMFSVILIIIVKKYKANLKNRLHKNLPLKYILLWTSENTIPFLHLGKGRSGFIRRDCAYTNCFVTSNKSLLGNTTAFDAILFHGPELMTINLILPEERLPHQKFVFASIESPANYPLCIHNFNGYFNWTWTYKLDSDINWGFIVVKDSNGTVVGPKKDMHWIDWKDMDPVNETFKYQLKSKHSDVAWFVSNCFTQSKREYFVERLKVELRNKYERDIHVYGDCGVFSCDRKKQNSCGEMLTRDYFFYLSFENAFSEDYVTEKLLHALQNNVVPIVYGGANYSRFLPHRSYLNARELKVKKLARIIDQLIREPSTYSEFFRWKKYYSYHRTIKVKETNEYCKMCAALNNEELMKTTSVCNDFSDFWEVNNTC